MTKAVISRDTKTALKIRSVMRLWKLDEAPESAHVKRKAQEDFEPEAFVAFGQSFDAFEALM